jgi:bifunctional ADP-heptose synthase (sugar kinase/adenylyltransferase)
VVAAIERRGVECRLLAGRDPVVERRTFVADDAKLFKLTDGGGAPLDSAAEKAASRAVLDGLAGAALLLWCDHGYGMITPGLLSTATTAAKRRAVVVGAQAPGRSADVRTLRSADVIAVTEKRLRLALHDLSSGLPAVVWALLNNTQVRAAFVSLHKRGLMGFERASRAPVDDHGEAPRLKSEFVPSFATHTVDRLGADDAIFVAATLTVASGGGVALATYLAAAAEALAVGRLGSHPAQSAALHAWLERRPELRADSHFFPDAATVGDLARLAPPLAVEQR